MSDYDRERSQFSWDVARGWLQGLPGGRGLNIAHEAIDRHAMGSLGSRVAIRWISRTDARRDYTYGDLYRATNRFANVLQRLGVGKGDVVATLAGRIPGLYVTALGTLKNGSVYTPLYSAFGPDPIVSRMTIARARVLVTTDVLYRKKVQPVRAQMPALEHVLLVRETTRDAPARPPTISKTCSTRANDDFDDPSHRRSGPRAASLHERDDREAEGCHARARGGGRALRHRSLRARFSSGRSFLVHGRSWDGSRERRMASSRRSRTG